MIPVARIHAYIKVLFVLLWTINIIYFQIKKLNILLHPLNINMAQLMLCHIVLI